MAILRVIDGCELGQVHELKLPKTVLGRSPECHIVLKHDAVSRKHAIIELVDNEWFIEDCRSHNKTHLNGEALLNGPRGRKRLCDDDRIEIGDLTFAFQENACFEGSVVLERNDAAAESYITSSISVASETSCITVDDDPAYKLRAGLKIIQNLANTIEVRDVLSKVLDGLFQVFGQAERGFVLLRESTSDEFVIQVAKSRDNRPEQVRFSQTIINKIVTDKTATLSQHPSREFQHSESLANFELRSTMCAPLLDHDREAMGVIELDVVDPRKRFTDEDLHVLVAVAQHAAILIENARLHEITLRERDTAHELKRMRRDLELARDIQKMLLPSSPPTVPGYEFFDKYQPAEQVGGDYYDYIYLPNDRVVVVVADVVGEGIPAALLMARFAGETRNCLTRESTTAMAIQRLNEGLTRAVQGQKFITLVVAEVRLRDHHVTIVNAGHWPHLLRHCSGEIQQIAASSACFPLGIQENSTYTPCTIKLEPGDRLMMFTDGIIDIANEERERYGIDRLSRRLGTANGSVEELGRSIFDDVKDFADKQAQADDMCLVCIGRKEA